MDRLHLRNPVIQIKDLALSQEAVIQLLHCKKQKL